MKSLYSLLFITLCMLSSIQQTVFMLYFKWNQQALTEQFCINKDKPMLQCLGTCYLKKKMEQTKDTDTILSKKYHHVEMYPLAVLHWPLTVSIYEITIQYAAEGSILYVDPDLKTLIAPPRIYA